MTLPKRLTFQMASKEYRITKHEASKMSYPKYFRVKTATGNIDSREGTFAIRMLK
jgi:hypothetical protein